MVIRKGPRTHRIHVERDQADIPTKCTLWIPSPPEGQEISLDTPLLALDALGCTGEAGRLCPCHSSLVNERIQKNDAESWGGEEAHSSQIRATCALCLLLSVEFASSRWAVACGSKIHSPLGAGSCNHCCLLTRLACCPTEEVQDGASVPWVRPVLLVVEL